MNTLPKMCDYKLSNWRECGHRAHFVSAKIIKNGRKFVYTCADHATAESITWPSPDATALIVGKPLPELYKKLDDVPDYNDTEEF